ncbi:unnamed protein product [Camellia sinensis]
MSKTFLLQGILPRILINYNSHVLNHALSGIAVSMVMKYAGNIDNIVKTRNATRLVAPAIAASLGALPHSLGTLVPVID